MQEYPKWVTNPKTKERVLVLDETQEEQVLGKKKPAEKSEPEPAEEPEVLDEAQEEPVDIEEKPEKKPKK
jgi:hypothetical protein